jgi:chromosome segregation ATPase
MAVTIEELQEKFEALEKAHTDKTKELDGLQSLKGKWSNEVGEVRKQIEDLTAREKVVAEKLEAATKELESLKSKPAGKTENPPPAPKLSDKELADKLESDLTDAEKKDVEGLYNKLPDSEKKAFVEDDTFRVAVLKQAKTGSGQVNPNSPWRVVKPAPPPSSEELENRVKELFKKHRAGDTLIEQRGGGYGERKVSQDSKPKKFL